MIFLNKKLRAQILKVINWSKLAFFLDPQLGQVNNFELGPVNNFETVLSFAF